MDPPGRDRGRIKKPPQKAALHAKAGKKNKTGGFNGYRRFHN
jgi:hypothetical protein